MISCVGAGCRIHAIRENFSKQNWKNACIRMQSKPTGVLFHIIKPLHTCRLCCMDCSSAHRERTQKIDKKLYNRPNEEKRKKSVSNNIAFIHSCVCTRDSLYGAVIYVRLCTNMLWLANRSVEKVCFLATCECLRVFAVWFGSFCDSQHNLNSQESAFGQKALFY